MLRATQKQKRFIYYINEKLGIKEDDNLKIVNSIETFEEADKYIKKYLPIAKIKGLSFKEIRFLYYQILLKVEKLLLREF